MISASTLKKYDKYSQAELLKKCQMAFNKFIRLRDAENGCISCGGKVSQAGHYLSQGHHSALRFDENNTNGQCVRCNLFLSGNLINYRKGLVKKIGEDAVNRLESVERKSHKWERTDLIFKIEHYKLKTK